MITITVLAIAIVALGILVLISERNIHFDLRCLLYFLISLTVELLREASNGMIETSTYPKGNISVTDFLAAYSWALLIKMLSYVILGGLGVFLARDSIIQLCRQDSTDTQLNASNHATIPTEMTEYMAMDAPRCNPNSMSTNSIAKADMVVSTAEECKQVLSAKRAPKLGIQSTGNIYEARALPNQRLVAAFGIKNSFTAHTKGESQEFRRKAEEKLYLFDEAWKGIALAVKKAVDDQLNTADQSISLFQFTQMVSMRGALYVLFGLDSGDGSLDTDIGNLAHEINAQWIRSKGNFNPAIQPPWQFKGQEDLLKALKGLFGTYEDHDRDNNPLNLILPGYETLWRVVLRCFIEVVARPHRESENWCHILQAFANTPTIEQLDENIGRTPVSASDIAKEALRLYPPTRRVYRDLKVDGEMKRVAADIEDAQRSADPWGDDPLIFRPERWNERNLSNSQVEQRAFLAFSTPPFACPARRRYFKTESDGNQKPVLPFGIAMIALIVGFMTAGTVNNWDVVGELPPKDQPLETDRESYHDLLLRKRVIEEPGATEEPGGDTFP